MKDLVELKKGKVYCTSICIGKEFEIAHQHILERIRKLTHDIPTVKIHFTETTFKNERNREYPMYHMTRRGYMSLIMNLEAKSKSSRMKLTLKKELFIDAFELMESMIIKRQVNENNLEWQKSREQGKQIRLGLTDVIKDFVDYAISQGSKSANRYYGNITKMEYKALGLMQQKNINLRDSLDLMETHQLILAEDLCRKQLRKYMSEKLHYKEIYILVKQDIENFAKALMIGN